MTKANESETEVPVTNTARDIMHPNVLCVEPNELIESAIEKMNDKKTGSILVTSENKLVGIFTERDILMHGATPGFYQSKISNYMTKNPTSIHCDTSIADIYANFSTASFRHLPIVDEENIPTGMISIRDLVRAWANYLESEKNILAKEYERAMSIIVHDLRSPISAVKAINELLLGVLEDPQEFVEGGFPKLVDDSCKTMLDLINDLLEISTIKSGHVHLEKECASIVEIAENVYRQMRPSAEEKHIKLNFNSEVTDPLAEVDERRMTQVFTNLLSNAIKYSDEGLEIHFSISDNENGLKISIVDHGQGIPAKELPSVFKEMCKISSKPTKGEASTGLGLSISKKLVEAHGGEITVVSEAYKKTEFTVLLPKGNATIAA